MFALVESEHGAQERNEEAELLTGFIIIVRSCNELLLRGTV